MRTVLAASLLVLLAAVACGAEAPEPVATTEPSAAGSRERSRYHEPRGSG